MRIGWYHILSFDRRHPATPSHQRLPTPTVSPPVPSRRGAGSTIDIAQILSTRCQDRHYYANFGSSRGFEGRRSTQRAESSTFPTTSCTFRYHRAYPGSLLVTLPCAFPSMSTSSLYGIHRTPISTPGHTRRGRLTARRNCHHTSELRVTHSPHMLSAFLDCFLCCPTCP